MIIGLEFGENDLRKILFDLLTLEISYISVLFLEDKVTRSKIFCGSNIGSFKINCIITPFCKV